MDVTAITQIISSLGFPIAVCCYMFYERGKEREAHAVESQRWVDALNQNTTAITKLCTFMEDREGYHDRE